MMVLNRPNREALVNAYREYSGTEISGNTLELFYRMTSAISKSQLRTDKVCISWEDGIVRFSRRNKRNENIVPSPL